MSKAQVSVEYLIIVGFVATITIPLIIIFNAHSQEMNEQIISNQVEHLASKIVDAAESVYYLGEPSKVTFRVQIPPKIQAINIGNNEVVFLVKKHNGIDHVVQYSPVPINGSVPHTRGIHDIVVESREDHVWVSG